MRRRLRVVLLMASRFFKHQSFVSQVHPSEHFRQLDKNIQVRFLKNFYFSLEQRSYGDKTM